MDKFYADIIAGIALEEAGIAHILNAEGEKVQLAVSKCCDISQLLEVNASVACTVEELMWLEFISYHKLKALLGVCGCRDFEKEEIPNKKPCGGDKKTPQRKSPCKKSTVGTRDCTPIKKCSEMQKNVEIRGRVFKENGENVNCGVVTANANGVISTDICNDGSYILKNLKPTNKIVVNAHSQNGKTGSFLLKKPFKDSYQIDMFLDG